MSLTMKKLILIAVLGSSFLLSAQRIVFPGQDLIYPHLNNPSYVGMGDDATVLGILQVSDYPRKQHSHFINAQLPVRENFSFGVDYFKDGLEYYNYSSAMGSLAYKFDFASSDSYLRLGISAGFDSRRQDRFPIDAIPNLEEFVPRINESQLGFNYRAGIHYTYKNLTVGGSYNKLPIQSVLVRNNIEDMIGYWIKEGYTASLRYGFDLNQALRLTPVLRYLSYANDPIYEAALLANVGDWATASISYKNDYSINPAIRFQFFDALHVGYSYEKSLGDVNFEDIHSLSIAYDIKGDGAIDSEWEQNAEETNKKVDAIKPEKEKKPSNKDLQKQRDSITAIQEVPEPLAEAKVEEVKAPKEKKLSRRALRKQRRDSIAAITDVEKLDPVVVEEKPEPIEEVKEVILDPEPVVEAKPEPVEVKEVIPDPEPVMEEKPEPVVVKKPVVRTPIKTSTDKLRLKTGYYVVVGTFDTAAAAEAEKQRLKALDYFTAYGTKAGDAKYYLYVDSDKREANGQKRLNAHKLDKNFRNAFLLKVQ